jgi:hypothetical protein
VGHGFRLPPSFRSTHLGPLGIPVQRGNIAMLPFVIFSLLALGNVFGATCDRSCLKTTLESYIVDDEAALCLFQRKPGVAMQLNLLSEWFFILLRHGAELAAPNTSMYRW